MGHPLYFNGVDTPKMKYVDRIKVLMIFPNITGILSAVVAKVGK
jgi:hypothetical protein